MNTPSTNLKAIASLVLALALFGAACAEGDVAIGEDAATTTTAAPDESTTTTAAVTTTTQEPTSTTAVGPSDTNAAFDALVATVKEAPELASGRIEATVAITGLDEAEAGVAEAGFGFTTTFDTDANRSSFVMDLSSLAAAAPMDPNDPFAGLAEAFTGTMEVRQIEDTAYLKMPFFTELLGVSTPWLEVTAEDGEGFTSDFSTVPSDPEDVMTAYEGADVTVEDLGSETVNGVATTHYRVAIDTSAWLQELSADERAELEASGLFADGEVPMDVWISAEGYLVRLLFEIDGSTFGTAPGEGFEAMSMRYDLFDINEPVSIEAPPPSEVTSFEDLGFGDFDFGFDTEA